MTPSKFFVLKSMGILKVYCVDCCKEFGFTIGDHSKNTIHNLFVQKKLNNLISSIHMRNWCQRKRAQFSNHPQSQAPIGKSIVLTTSDHQALVVKGIEISSAMNETSANEKKTICFSWDLELKEIITLLGYSKQSKGIVSDNK